MEFSKIILLSVMFTYYVGVGVSVFVVGWVDHTQLHWLLTFIGSPVAVAIGFYAWKAKAENVAKISNNQKVTELEFEFMRQVGPDDNR